VEGREDDVVHRRLHAGGARGLADRVERHVGAREEVALALDGRRGCEECGRVFADLASLLQLVGEPHPTGVEARAEADLRDRVGQRLRLLDRDQLLEDLEGQLVASEAVHQAVVAGDVEDAPLSVVFEAVERRLVPGERLAPEVVRREVIG
jgi:hypothetical protein